MALALRRSQPIESRSATAPPKTNEGQVLFGWRAPRCQHSNGGVPQALDVPPPQGCGRESSSITRVTNLGRVRQKFVRPTNSFL